MPILTTSGPPAITDLAQRLVSDLNEGRTARQSINSTKGTAFSWSVGLPMTLARQVASATTDGLSFNAVQVKPSGTPAAKVLPGGTKPNAVTLTSGLRSLAKFAGLAQVQTEQVLDTDALIPALVSVIGGSCLLAFDADCVAALNADAGATGAGGSWPAAILDGIGAVASAGGAPDVLVLAAADYAAAAQSPGVGYALSPTEGVVTLYGLRVVLSPSVASGTAYVLDSSAVLAVEHESGPFAVVDSLSLLATNEHRVAVEMFAAFTITAPGAVAEVTMTPV